MSDQNREAWLAEAAEIFTDWFKVLTDREVPPFRVSVGWPARAKTNITRGQCWPTTSAEDKLNQVFISPMQADTVTVLAVLLHEMIHVVDDCKNSHKGDFITMARALGFTTKWTSSDNRTPELTERLEKLAADLGDFPSAAVILGGRAADAPKPQTNRQLKVVCSSNPDYKARLSRKMIDDYGVPLCPCHDEEMIEA